MNKLYKNLRWLFLIISCLSASLTFAIRLIDLGVKEVSIAQHKENCYVLFMCRATKGYLIARVKCNNQQNIMEQEISNQQGLKSFLTGYVEDHLHFAKKEVQNRYCKFLRYIQRNNITSCCLNEKDKGVLFTVKFKNCKINLTQGLKYKLFA